ncbi:hypothetical protein SAMN04487968_11731 [Nocardioides terrae]|uniref:Uncharacterized protein n=1 Tax=Nocardioides terrae TaxID=574651 RepID=A0A1I1NNV1_9ACTN|nr:hypothetical protein [Nocardioides terrae]SFC97158.1 hypothetical protein SAMN04487968_11731 [Nocardioides terrae]
MTAPSRPSRVVIVDADNPLVEIQGEFFWREDHEAALAAARAEAYRSGYRAGYGDAASRGMPPTVAYVRRPSRVGRVKESLLWLLFVVGLLIVAITVGQQLISQR